MATHQIISMKRGSTSNSSSPMWRCETATGERVNVFKHDKPERNTFAFFEKAGYAPEMDAMRPDDVLTWEAHPVSVTMVQTDPDAKGTRWWNVTAVDPRAAAALPDPQFAPDPSLARVYARDWADMVTDPLINFLILDTETTDANPLNAEIVSIAIINGAGDVLLNKLVQPTNLERLTRNGSGAINGIHPDDLKNAPTFAEAHAEIYAALAGEHIIIYNADYDWTVLERECQRHGKVMPYPGSVTCAMEVFARYHGEWNKAQQRWQSKTLSHAAEYVGVGVVNAHEALGDCLTTRRVIEAMSDGCVAATTDEIPDISF